MATASFSLNNMSVPGADQSPSNQTLLMPKLQYRFRILFINFGTSAGADSYELTRQVVDCARPNASFQKISLPVYNSTIYMTGKHTWQPISLTLRDDASGAISRLVGQQLQKQMDFVEQASAASAADYKFQMLIEMLDGGNGVNVPVVLETWELYGCLVESVNYNTLNYGTSEDVKIGMSIQFDNAIQSPLGTGVGSPVARGNPIGTATSVGT